MRCRVRRFKFAFVFAVFLSCCAGSRGAEYYVSPAGVDTNQGTKELPFATILKASSVMQPGDTCFLRRGTYREVLRPARSGEERRPMTYRNFGTEQVILTGAEPLADWKDEGGGIYSAAMPWSLEDGNQVFAGGTMLTEACWPNAGDEPLFHPARAAVETGSASSIKCAGIPGAQDAWKGAELWCAGGSAWICWTVTVSGYDETAHTLSFTPREGWNEWYIPRRGNLFVLRGARVALDAPGEWYYDQSLKRLLVIPPVSSDIAGMSIEAKRRDDIIDLSGLSHVRISGITFRCGGIRTDERTSNIVLENIKGAYVSHSYRKGGDEKSGILVLGDHILLLSCDLGFSSASVLTVKGHDNRVINCNIHHGGYAGLWRGTVVLAGRRQLFSHNTVRHAGRDLINTHGLMESLVQYNDVSDAGWLTDDLGMFYGHNTDFANTVFQYNLVHDNRAKHCAMGIYFDHLSHNAIVRHNIIWNVGMDPIRFNNPGYCNLVFNNTCWRTGTTGTFDHSRRDDLYACRYFDNVFNQPIHLPSHVVVTNNVIQPAPPFVDPASRDFRPKRGELKGVGALSEDGAPWKAGCDLEKPPDPPPVHQLLRIDWMNTVKNACFEFGTLEGWDRSGVTNATLVDGNGWGNKFGRGKACRTGTSKFELRLGPGEDGVTQVISGLAPSVKHTVSAWLKVSDTNEVVSLQVTRAGARIAEVCSSDTEWTRKSLEFTVDPASAAVVIGLVKKSAGPGHAWCDNVTLPLVAASTGSR